MAGTVVIVDEARMVGTPSLHRFAAELWACGGKLLVVGDVHQLPEIFAGGAFRGLLGAGRLTPIELERNMRQLDAGEQQRLLELRGGSVADAPRSYDEAGHVTRAKTSEDVRNLLAVDWSVGWLAESSRAASPTAVAMARSGHAMIALTDADVEDRRAHVLLKAAGVLIVPELTVGDVERGFMTGDHVVTRKVSR